MKIKRKIKKKFKLEILEIIKQVLLDDKVINLKIIDIRKKSNFADFMILGTGTSNRHIINMAKNVKEKIKENSDFTPSIEGMEQSNWVLIDANSIVINIFKPETREFYNLENIWNN
jgi:ribosome silencing factor RsfS/YbeB/iojap